MSISWRLSKDPSKDQTQSHHWGLRYLRVDVKPKVYDKNKAYKEDGSGFEPRGMNDYVRGNSKYKVQYSEKGFYKFISKTEPNLIPPLIYIVEGETLPTTSGGYSSRLPFSQPITEREEYMTKHYLLKSQWPEEKHMRVATRNNNYDHNNSRARKLYYDSEFASERKYEDGLRKKFMESIPPKPEVMAYIEPEDYTHRLQRLMAVRYKKNIHLTTWSKLSQTEYNKAYSNQDFDLCDKYDHYWQICLLQKAIKWELNK